MAHEGHLGIVKLKHRCRDMVWWPGIDCDLEELVRFYTSCLIRGKIGHPAPSPPQAPDNPSGHLQLNVCGELHNVPHHQRFHIVLYDLHSKWPKVTPMGTVTVETIVKFLDQLFAQWGLPRAITTDKGPMFLLKPLHLLPSKQSVTHIHTSFYHPQANRGGG
jgi:hypothetical protein